MNIGEIDKDFVDIIKYLNDNGITTFSCCDGVLANHTDPDSIVSAYIAFIKSPKIIDIMAALNRDKDIFHISLSNDTDRGPNILYGNEISGNTYAVYFSNEQGEITSYFEKILKGVNEGEIKISEEEKEVLNKLDEILEEDLETDLNFDMNFNIEYQPFMQKEGKINLLTIRTKDGFGYTNSMLALGDILNEKYGIILKKDSFEESFEEDEFVVSSFDDTICEIYFKDQHIQQALELIRDIRQIGKTLPKREVTESDYDYYEDEIDIYFDDDEEPEF